MLITRNYDVDLKKHLPEFLPKDEEIKAVLYVESKEHRLSLEVSQLRPTKVGRLRVPIREYRQPQFT